MRVAGCLGLVQERSNQTQLGIIEAVCQLDRAIDRRADFAVQSWHPFNALPLHTTSASAVS